MKTKNKILLFTALLLFGILTDVLLSVNAYLKNPDFFVKYEANREFANFLAKGDIPFLFLFSFFGLFLFCYMIIKVVNMRTKYKKHIVYSYCLFCFCAFCLRTIGGLSWSFVPLDISPIIFTLQFFSYIMLVIITIFYILIRTQEREKGKNAMPDIDY